MSTAQRVHALDSVRGFALLLGVVFHATLSFLPGLPKGAWPMADNSPSMTLALVFYISHIFRMSLFFFLAGYFAHLMFHRNGARSFWADRRKRILAPLLVGWVVLFPCILAIYAWGYSIIFGSSMPENLLARSDLPPAFFPLTHLWFLYYLLWMYAVISLGRTLIDRVQLGLRARRVADAFVKQVMQRPWLLPALALPLATALFTRENWLMWQGIPTPDQTLIPQVASFVGYGVAFAFGWLLHRQSELLEQLQRTWQFHLIAATALTCLCLWIAGPTFSLTPLATTLAKAALATAYAYASWSWIFAITGLALRFVPDESPTRRYVADASYWIYLAHLPIVMALQVVVGQWPLHWSVKFVAILAVALVILFASYHLLVRPTFLGQILNGRRYPRHRAVAAAANQSVGDSS